MNEIKSMNEAKSLIGGIEYKVLNNRLMAYRQKGRGSWQIRDNIFESAKAYCIWAAKESSSNYLPRFVIEIDEWEYPDLHDWRRAFTSDNAPGETSFKGKDRELADAIKDIDFSKPFNAEVADNIRANFRAVSTRKVDVDVDLVIQGELGELEDKP